MGRSQAELSIIERLARAESSQIVLEVFEKALNEIGAEYLAVIFLPRAGERIEDVSLAWKVPAAWREMYSSENFFERDPAVRQSKRTVLPFDWETARYDPETEGHWAEVLERGRDFGIHKGIAVPVPSRNGMIGAVWVGGPNFDEREPHKPLVHSLGLHVFHRLEHFLDKRSQRVARLTEREREILSWVCEGKTAWEIGCILNLSQRTVEWHIDQACKRLGAATRLQAIAILGDASNSLRRETEDAS